MLYEEHVHYLIFGKSFSKMLCKCYLNLKNRLWSPPGSILGPVLFSIYIHDLPNCIEKSTVRRMFAHDTTLTASV